MKVISEIVRVLSWIAYIVIAAALLIAAPILLGNRPVIILSGSMEPTYPVGSITYYKPESFDRLSTGDAITFRLGESDSLATHRITAINEENRSFTTKGDANPTEDPSPVTYSQVAGKTSKIAIPYAGYFVNHVKNWRVIAAMAVILLLNMLLPEGASAGSPRRESTPAVTFEMDEPSPAERPRPASEPAAVKEKKASDTKKPKRKNTPSAEDFFSDL